MRRETDRIEPEKAQRPGARDDPRLDWWRAAQFGAFVHWGLYALPEAQTEPPGPDEHWTQEWVMKVRRVPVAEYETLAGRFNPTRFDAAEWVRLFREAGQRYLVVTAKHHDGFCLFQSEHTDFNVVDATPFARDVIAELAEACAAEGLRFGVYYSQTQDWHHPDGHGNDWDFDPEANDFDSYVERYVKPQVRELLTRYGPVAIVWFDTPMVMRREQSRELLELVHDLQPDCLVCGRVGHGLGDYATSRDNQYLTAGVGMDWECPATMNDTWGYRADDDHWKSVDELVANLRDVVSAGGNYLLNVGPTPEGEIPRPSVQRLRAIGRRLREHPDALRP
jgi:alpha-L-fucosidase